MNDSVQAMQLSEADECREPAIELPIDHAALVTSAMPLLSIALFLGLMLVRSAQ